MAALAPLSSVLMSGIFMPKELKKWTLDNVQPVTKGQDTAKPPAANDPKFAQVYNAFQLADKLRVSVAFRAGANKLAMDNRVYDLAKAIKRYQDQVIPGLEKSCKKEVKAVLERYHAGDRTNIRNYKSFGKPSDNCHYYEILFPSKGEHSETVHDAMKAAVPNSNTTDVTNELVIAGAALRNAISQAFPMGAKFTEETPETRGLSGKCNLGGDVVNFKNFLAEVDNYESGDEVVIMSATAVSQYHVLVGLVRWIFISEKKKQADGSFAYKFYMLPIGIGGSPVPSVDRTNLFAGDISFSCLANGMPEVMEQQIVESNQKRKAGALTDQLMEYTAKTIDQRKYRGFMGNALQNPVAMAALQSLGALRYAHYFMLGSKTGEEYVSKADEQKLDNFDVWTPLPAASDATSDWWRSGKTPDWMAPQKDARFDDLSKLLASVTKDVSKFKRWEEIVKEQVEFAAKFAKIIPEQGK